MVIFSQNCTIEEATRLGDISRIVARFEKIERDSMAPAALSLDPNSVDYEFDVHKQIARDRFIVTFETYNSAQPLPKVGTTYTWHPWWLPWALDAVVDENANWQLCEYPEDEAHTHCLLTWETIAAYVDHRVGYVSKHGWITLDAYNEYIRDDVLRLRS